VRDNLEVKEIVIANGEARTRYILVRNPEEAARNKAKREETIEKLKLELARIGELDGAPHTKAVCNLIAHPTNFPIVRSPWGKPCCAAGLSVNCRTGVWASSASRPVIGGRHQKIHADLPLPARGPASAMGRSAVVRPCKGARACAFSLFGRKIPPGVEKFPKV